MKLKHFADNHATWILTVLFLTIMLSVFIMLSVNGGTLRERDELGNVGVVLFGINGQILFLFSQM